MTCLIKKSVAFVGSGNFFLEGLKDYEALFWKVTDPKEVESLMSWFTGYFEFGTPLSEAMIQEYELILPVYHWLQTIEAAKCKSH